MTTTASSAGVVRPLPLSPGRRWQPADSLERSHPYSQGSLALSFPLTSGLDAAPRPTAHLTVAPGGGAGGGPGPEEWAAAFVQAVVEVIACDRPLTQLVRWTSKRVYADIARRQQLAARRRPAAAGRSTRHQVATVRVCQPTSESAEIAARLIKGGRSQAVAVRLDYVNGRWLCTALQLG